MYRRTLNPLESNSFFIFGARGVGKTNLVEAVLADKRTLYIDLLDPIQFEAFDSNPGELTARLTKGKEKYDWVVIDEVQKIPLLLDVVHSFIERSHLKFALTGSSARKLMRGGANLLAGRAYTYHLFPLTHDELEKDFNLQEILEWGTLPKIFSIKTEEEKKIFLQTYAFTYIKEEIQAEQLIRKIDPFRRFLSIIGQTNGQIVNYANIARDIGAADVTIKNYFQILEDTLLGFLLDSFHQSIRKRQRANPKFYLFDTGVQRAISKTLDIPLKSGTYAYGKAFEHFLIVELFRMSSYRRNDFSFSYLRTKDDAEIDLIVERPGMPTALIEIKSTSRVTPQDVSTLKKFIGDFKNAKAYCLSTDPHPKIIDGVECLPWNQGILEILG